MNPWVKLLFHTSFSRVTDFLIEGALLGTTLQIPSTDAQPVRHTATTATTMVAYDPNRAKVMAVDQDAYSWTTEGRLGLLMLASVDKAPAARRTPLTKGSPIGMWRGMEIRQNVQPDALVRSGYLHTPTYEEAFSSLYLDHHIPWLERAGLAQQPVYQVTPKGNGMVFLWPGAVARGPKLPPRRDALLPRVLRTVPPK